MTRIGMSGPDVFPLCLGGNVFGWTADRDASFAILDAFADGGGTFIDTADQYSVWAQGNPGGVSETIIGDWLADRRPEGIVIATKVGKHPDMLGLAPDTVRRACEASLQRLGLESIDVYYAHQDDQTVPILETVQAFAELEADGLVRHVGLSNFEAPRMRAWLDAADRLGVARPVVLQPEYNLVERGIEAELLPAAVDAGLTVVPYYSLASGFLTGKYRSVDDRASTARSGRAASYATPENLRAVDALMAIAEQRGVEPATVALAWLRAQPGVVAPIASASTASQVDSLLASGRLELDGSELELLDAA